MPPAKFLINVATSKKSEYMLKYIKIPSIAHSLHHQACKKPRTASCFIWQNANRPVKYYSSCHEVRQTVLAGRVHSKVSPGCSWVSPCWSERYSSSAVSPRSPLNHLPGLRLTKHESLSATHTKTHSGSVHHASVGRAFIQSSKPARAPPNGNRRSGEVKEDHYGEGCVSGRHTA